MENELRTILISSSPGVGPCPFRGSEDSDCVLRVYTALGPPIHHRSLRVERWCVLTCCCFFNPMLRTNLKKQRLHYFSGQKIYLKNQCHEGKRTFFSAMSLGEFSKVPFGLEPQKGRVVVCRGPGLLVNVSG